MGNAPLADEIWDSMYDHQVIPDTACFNHFMGATIWDHCYVGKERFNLQINPDSYKKRRMNQPNVGWQGYGTAEHSVRKVIMNIFSDMTQIGLSGDEQTYINIIVAAGRVGDKDAVYNVLQAVWNVDVRALMAEKDNSKVPQVTQYETWSGLYPTERLLFAVAHVFGATCDIHAAIRTIDFLSSSYDIPISHEVWHELLERTFVLTKTHQGKQAELDRWGTVPKEMVYQVFETMTAEPYNVPPTVKAYRMLSQTSAFLGNFKKCQSEIRQAHDVYSKTLAKRKEARDMVMQCLQPILNDMRQKADNGYSDPQTDPLLFQCPLLAEAIHIYDILRLEVYQQLAQLKRIAKTISSKKEWQDFSVHTWERRVRPKFHEEWKDFLADFPEFECNEAGKIRFEDYYCYRPRNEIRQGLISVRRLPGHAELFTPVEEHVLDDNTVWKVLLEQWPGLDPSVSPINRLYSFQVPPSKSLIAKLKKLHCRFDVPSDFPVAAGNNATGGFYARLVRQGLLMNTHRTPYWRDGNHWLED
jgi:hypothetical protein